MDEDLRFENAIFCSSNCNFLKFTADKLSLLLIFSLFIFNNALTTESIPHCIVNKIPTP